MSTLKVNSIEPANAGSEDYFLAKAWISFNNVGATSVRASGNVSSMTDNGTGNNTISWSTAFSDANYAYTFGTKSEYTDTTPRLLFVKGNETVSTTQLRTQLGLPSGSIVDVPISNVVVTR